MSATINDVAKEAGVSPSTVSKVLNNWSTISEETTRKVQDAIQRLDYTPNARAVSFARKSSNNILFLTSLEKEQAYLNPHMFEIMCGVHKALTDAQYTMMLTDTSNEGEKGSTVKRMMAQKCADGMIIHGSAINEETASIIVKEQYPHIIVGKPTFENELCWVDTNHALAGQYAAKHMLSMGYERIAFIGGCRTDHISMQRQRGFLGRMFDYGCSVPDSYIRYTNSSLEESYQASYDVLSSHKEIEAVVCENNLIAIGCLQAVRALSLKIPDNLGFLTFDRYPYAGIMTPIPTVVDINMYDLGVQAGTMMVQKLHHPSMQIQSFITLPVLCQGESTRRMD
ncbi:MAG: LacI family transcriptional regulator [Lachnospiraceae bacterium]|nr:LacI family transcriptional regulator [Lachnospiraceae bacterium]